MITGVLRFLVSPCSVAYFSVKCAWFTFAANSVVIIEIRVAKIQSSFLPLDIQFFIGRIFQKITEFVFLVENYQN